MAFEGPLYGVTPPSVWCSVVLACQGQLIIDLFPVHIYLGVRDVGPLTLRNIVGNGIADRPANCYPAFSADHRDVCDSKVIKLHSGSSGGGSNNGGADLSVVLSFGHKLHWEEKESMLFLIGFWNRLALRVGSFPRDGDHRASVV